jgi:hypothetical protein
MLMKTLVLLIGQLVLTAGCVTTGMGPLALSADKSLQISCAGRPEIYNEPYIGISCTIKNLASTPTTLKIETVKVMGDEREFVVLGVQDIQELALVYKDRRLDNNNLIFLAALLAAASQSNDSAGLVMPVALTAIPKLPAPASAMKYSNAHILSAGVTLEGKSEVTKDFLVSRPNKDSIPISVTICMTPPHTECVRVRPEISHDIYRLRQYE